jgi:hypothetical protein
LADDLRLGAIKRKVYKQRGRFEALGYRAKGYRWARGAVVRVRNQLKSLYRSPGCRWLDKGCTRLMIHRAAVLRPLDETEVIPLSKDAFFEAVKTGQGPDHPSWRRSGESGDGPAGST